jgi:hypothetical protein
LVGLTRSIKENRRIDRVFGIGVHVLSCILTSVDATPFFMVWRNRRNFGRKQKQEMIVKTKRRTLMVNRRPVQRGCCHDTSRDNRYTTDRTIATRKAKFVQNVYDDLVKKGSRHSFHVVDQVK